MKKKTVKKTTKKRTRKNKDEVLPCIQIKDPKRTRILNITDYHGVVITTFYTKLKVLLRRQVELRWVARVGKEWKSQTIIIPQKRVDELLVPFLQSAINEIKDLLKE